MKGRLVTETFDFDGGRQVTVYVPPQPAQAIVYAGDGRMVIQWCENLEVDTLPPVMIVGTDSREDQKQRLHEYSPAFDPEVFEPHAKFFMDEVRSWVISRFGVNLPRERTVVYGASASGDFALTMGTRHPDIFGAILCASPGGGYQPTETLSKKFPRTFLLAGTEEPFFEKNAKIWYQALQRAGVDVEMVTKEGKHESAFWQNEFRSMVEWAFDSKRMGRNGS